MSNYNLKMTSLDGTLRGGVTPDLGFYYTENMGVMNEAEIKISALGNIRQSIFVVGASLLEIRKKGTLVFKGVIEEITSLDAGGTRAFARGSEVRLADERGSYASSPYKTVASATIADDIIGESSYFTAGTHDVGSNEEFRIDPSSSLWDALKRLADQVGQEIEINYSTMTVRLVNALGSATSVATLNDGNQITNVKLTYGRPLANYVVVKGKGDGADQISSDSGHGQDATSQSTYGVRKKIIYDPSIMTPDQADTLADAEVARLKDPTKIYSFSVTKKTLALSVGDVVKLNVPDRQVVKEDVRIVGIQRGVGADGKETVSLEVTNSAHSRLVKKSMEVISDIRQENRDAGNYMQGSTNLIPYPFVGNGGSSVPMDFWVYVPAEVEDEAGNVRLNAVTLSYSNNEFKSEAGISGAVTAASTGNSMNNDQENAGHTISNNETGASGDTGYILSDGGDDLNFTDSSTWEDVSTSKTTSAFEYLHHGIFGVVRMDFYDAAASNVLLANHIYVRAYNLTLATYFPSSSGILISNGYSIYQGVRQTRSYPFYLHIPEVWKSDTYKLQYKLSGNDNWDTTNGEQIIYYTYFGTRGVTPDSDIGAGDHTHTNSITDPTHPHSDSFDTSESLGLTDNSPTDTVIKINNASDVEVWNSGNRGSTKEDDVDISSYLTGKGWYRILIYPNQNSRVHANVKIKTAVDS